MKESIAAAITVVRSRIKDYDITKEKILSELKEIWENSTISFIGQNIKYDCIILSRFSKYKQKSILMQEIKKKEKTY